MLVQHTATFLMLQSNFVKITLRHMASDHGKSK